MLGDVPQAGADVRDGGVDDRGAGPDLPAGAEDAVFVAVLLERRGGARVGQRGWGHGKAGRERAVCAAAAAAAEGGARGAEDEGGAAETAEPAVGDGGAAAGPTVQHRGELPVRETGRKERVGIGAMGE